MNYYNFLNESFDKRLDEAKQDDINFSNAFGQDMLIRFKAQKPRMKSPQNDYYYWIRKFNENEAEAIDELDAFVSGLEHRQTRKQKRELAAEGADLVYEDDDWLVLKINTYPAAAKYGSGTTWCITGRYGGHESRGEYYFNLYKERYGWDYYFYIKKNSGEDEDGRQEKYCLCYNAENESWEVWNAEDDNITEDGYGVPDAPQVEGLPDISGDPAPEPEEDDWEDELEPDEGEDEGHPHDAPVHHEPPVRDFINIDVEDPNDFEFAARSKEEAAAQFKDGAEIVDTIRDPDLHIVKWHEDAVEEGDTGDRYTLFVFIPGEGGGPLLAQTGNGFALQVFKDLDKVRQFAGGMPGVEIRNNRADTEDMPECLRENFYFYNDNSWWYDL